MLKKYFSKKKYFIINIFLIFAFIPFFPSFVLGATCLCTGEIRSGKTDFGTGGGTTYSPERDFRKCEYRLAECVNGNKAIECQIDLEKKYNSSTAHFFGSCVPSTCQSTGKTSKEACPIPQEEKDAATLKKLELRKPLLEIAIPDLKFSDLENKVDENGNLQIPWIGEYLKVIYRFAVTIASILGVVMLIREGLRIILSAGGDEKVQGYKNIGRVVTGLVLAWLSYVILYNINSDLVSFRALNIKLVSEIGTESDFYNPEFESANDFEQVVKSYSSTSPSSTVAATKISNVKACDWCGKSLDRTEFCKKFYSGEITACGYAPTDSLTKFSTCEITVKGSKITYNLLGKNGNSITVYASPDEVIPLCKAAEIALNTGYEIRFSSVYRDFTTQAKNWCEKGSQGGLRAKPGCSVHGTGLAQDIYLYKDGTQLTVIDGDNQCDKKAEDIKRLAEIMYAADPRFRRLEFETWHFEFNSKSDNCHLRTTEMPQCCSDRSCRQDAAGYCSGRKRKTSDLFNKKLILSATYK